MRKLRLVLAALTGALIVGCASGQTGDRAPSETRDFSTWDRNGDGALDSTEWDAGYARSGIFEVWDRDRDMNVDANEWSTGPVDWSSERLGYRYDWDWNDDFQIDKREFSNALFEAWDDNENLRLDELEFEMGVNALE